MYSHFLIARKFVFLFSLILVISACGGGGGGSDSTPMPVTPPPPPPQNMAPQVSAGEAQTVNEQTLVSLTGTATDSDGNISSIAWIQTSGTSVDIQSSNSLSASFTAPDVSENTNLVFELSVTDDDGTTSSDTVTVTINWINQAPVANAGLSITSSVGDLVNISGSESVDPDGAELSYSWFLSTPEGSLTLIDSNNGSSTTFMPDVAGEYQLALVVNDGELSSEPDIVTITVNASTTLKQASINGVIVGLDENGIKTNLNRENVKIEISLLDSNDELIATSSPSASFNPSFADELRFFSDIEAIGANSVLINISSDGFSSFHQRLPVSNGLKIQAELTELVYQSVEQTSNQTISGSTVDGFHIVNSDQQNQLLTSYAIPRTAIVNSVQTFTSYVQSFDAGDINQANLFPGVKRDSLGNQLVPITFEYVDTGTLAEQGPQLSSLNKPPQKAISNTFTDSNDAIIINHTISSSTCNILKQLGDSNETQVGFQLSVYVFDAQAGEWVLYGYADVYDVNANLIDNSLNCEQQNYLLEAQVSADFFDSQWWQIAYSIPKNPLSQQCARVQIQNTQQQLLPNIIGVMSDADEDISFTSSSFISNLDGLASIQVTPLSDVLQDSARVYFFNAQDFTVSSQEVDLYENCNSSPVQQVVLEQVLNCQISGKSVFVDGQAANNNLIYGFAVDGFSFGYDFTLTNDEGEYSLNLPCAQTANVVDLSASLANNEGNEAFLFEVNVDGVIDVDETSDDGQRVQTNNFRLPLFKPIIDASSDIDNNQILFSTFSLPASYPLTVSATVTAQNGSVVLGEINQVIENSSSDEALWYFGSGASAVQFEFPDSETRPPPYYISITVVDDLGNEFVYEALEL